MESRSSKVTFIDYLCRTRENEILNFSIKNYTVELIEFELLEFKNLFRLNNFVGPIKISFQTL